MSDKAIRILVTGSRGYPLKQVHRYFYEATTEPWNVPFQGPWCLIHGECKGSADEVAQAWVENGDGPGDTHEAYPVDHALDGPWTGAGPRRNARMVKAALANGGIDICLAFWDGKSRGTRSTIALAVQSGVEVRIIPPTPPRPEGERS